jgi:opacity protein-like surface antigen
MKFRLFLISLLFLLVVLPFAEAQARRSRIYLAGYMGLSVHPQQLEYTEGPSSREGDVELENGYNFAGALGIRINKRLSIEAELAYRKSDVANIEVNGGEETPIAGEIKSTTLMLNGVYDFDISWREIYPFVTAGVGLIWHDGEIYDPNNSIRYASGDDVGVAWTMGGGVKYDVDEGMAFTASYRYVGSSEIGFENTTIDYASHEMRLGVRYDLGVK